MARDVANVWWAMFGFSVVVLVVVSALWIYAMLRQPRTHSAEEAKRINRRWIIGGGLVLPTVSIVALLAFGIPTGRSMLPLPVEGEQPLRVQVIGHQWWWEVRYPESGVVTANQFILPIDRPVDVEVTSADVIHSFWVPRLGGKLDMVPGRTNTLRLQASQTGVFRGQCSEFCGSQHAHMILHVEARSRCVRHGSRPAPGVSTSRRAAPPARCSTSAAGSATASPVSVTAIAPRI